MQCSTQLVFHITRVHQWPVFYLMPVRLPGLSCRAQLVPMHGIIPSLLQDCSFVLAEFHEVAVPPDYGSLSEQQLGPPFWGNCKCRFIKMGKKKKDKNRCSFPNLFSSLFYCTHYQSYAKSHLHWDLFLSKLCEVPSFLSKNWCRLSMAGDSSSSDIPWYPADISRLWVERKAEW